ncbi:MAG: acetyltransferase [Sphingomonadales bacterium BRH_c42]|nr:MAG: acetyltransferase [Sphingomonadales bacterium BRH_c42]
MDRQPTLEGDAVRLRPLTESDRDALFAVASDRLVWEQHPIGDRWKPEVFSAFFDDAIQAGGALAVIDGAGGGVIGSSQFRPTSFDPEAIEIGWTFLARSVWGTRINREIKRLMLRHAFESVPRVMFRVGDTNWRSRKAMEKIGGVLTTLEERGEYRGQPVRHVVYEITRESFARGPLSS